MDRRGTTDAKLVKSRIKIGMKLRKAKILPTYLTTATRPDISFAAGYFVS